MGGWGYAQVIDLVVFRDADLPSLPITSEWTRPANVHFKAYSSENTRSTLTSQSCTEHTHSHAKCWILFCNPSLIVRIFVPVYNTLTLILASICILTYRSMWIIIWNRSRQLEWCIVLYLFCIGRKEASDLQCEWEADETDPHTDVLTVCILDVYFYW